MNRFVRTCGISLLVLGIAIAGSGNTLYAREIRETGAFRQVDQPLSDRSVSAVIDRGTREGIIREAREQAYAERAVRRYRDDEIIVKLRGENRFRRVRVRVGRDVPSEIADYQRRGDVVYAEPNYIAHAFATPNDPYFPLQWHLDNAAYGGVHATDAWDISTGAGVTVAVIDTGVAYETYRDRRTRRRYRQAPDLANTSFAPGYDFVNNDSHPNDDEGHGTHVAGTIAQSTNNGTGVAGLAYGATIMPIKVLNRYGFGTYADIADGIRWAADNGAQVINMSLGGSFPASYLEDALAYAYGKGVTIVAAAGNSGVNSVSYPAAYDSYVIAVGATRYDETRAPYSSYGSALDIMGPGGDLSVDQNGDGYGDGVLQQTFSGSYNNWGYYFYQGTSMATPHVAAAAALVIANGNATAPTDVRTALEETAEDLGALGRDDVYGWGLVDAAAALGWSSGGPPPPPPPPQDNPPTVSITNPADGAIVSGDVLIAADAADDVGINHVDFFVDGTLLLSDATAPYEAMWSSTSTANGTSTIETKAFDTASQSTSDAISVIVYNSVPPPPPPSGDVEVFFDSFEVGEWNGLWTEDAQNDWVRSSQRAVDGSYSAEVDGRARNSALISVPIDLQGKSNATITFSWLIERRLDRGEYLAFDISTDGGATWQEQRRLRGNVDVEDVWHEVSIEVNGISSLQLRFRGKMSRSNEDADVDLVKVVAN